MTAFSKNDIKIETDGETARLYATGRLFDICGKINFINLCDEGDCIFEGEWFGDFETAKGVIDLICPLNGEVIAVNSAILSDFEKANENSFLVEMHVSNPIPELMNTDEYTKYAETHKRSSRR